MNVSSAPQPTHSPPDSNALLRSSWLVWAALGAVTAIALILVVLSVELRAHADNRRDVMEKLTALQVAASNQNTLVWRAMTQLMANEKMAFNRTRGQEQRQRSQILSRLAELHELETSAQVWNTRLRFAPAPKLLEGLVSGTDSFLGGVQGALGMMNLSRERVRERLSHWDMNYGKFDTALKAVRTRDEAIAQASSRIANRVTGGAALITLLASLLFVISFAKIRARRTQDLQAERFKSVSASESRFRGLVQNSADLIFVLEADGVVRYATPSANALKASAPGASQFEADSSITPIADESVLGYAPLADQSERSRIEQIFGLTAAQLLAQERSEVDVLDSNGRRRVYEIRATDLVAHTDIGGIVLNGRDITVSKMLEAQLRHQAFHDPLTGLANRRSFTARYGQLTEQQQQRYCVLFIDLDGFKLVNDSYGHSVGDQLLNHTAARISTCLVDGDLLARQGGDEFIVLCSETSVAERIQSALAPPFEIGRGIGPSPKTGEKAMEIFVTASIGVVTSLIGIDAERASQRADIAMYKAKEAGKARAISFSDEMLDGAPERLALESDFRRALERDEFTVVYQPKVGLKSGVTESLEALVRWIHPSRGFVGPDLFIPFAEESGLVDELGRQVLEKACMDAVRWQPFGVVVAVNLSPIQFRNPQLVQEVRSALETSGLDPKFLELEITESAVLGDVQNTVRVMRELKGLGVRLAIDDFGTGYSNLAHLKHFDVDVLKIDQAFVRGENSGSSDQLSDGAIVKAVIGMAKAFDMHVVAEGVESSNHASQLKALGADLGQGYYFSKPISSVGIDEFLEAEVVAGRRASQVSAAI